MSKEKVIGQVTSEEKLPGQNEKTLEKLQSIKQSLNWLIEANARMLDLIKRDLKYVDLEIESLTNKKDETQS